MKYLMGAVWFALCLGLCSGVAAKSKTKQHLQMAHDAYAIGEMAGWHKGLKLADASFKKERSRMSFAERQDAQLWLLFYWSKYHQKQGAPPPVKGARGFEDKKAVQDHADKVRLSISHLKKAVEYLGQYLFAFGQTMKQANLRDEVIKQSLVSAEQNMVLLIRQEELYLLVLQQIASNWELKRQVKTNKVQLNKVKESIKSFQSIKQNQKHLAAAFQRAQQTYEGLQRKLEQRSTAASAVIWSGAGLAVVSAVGGGVGAFLLSQAGDTSLGVNKRQEAQSTGTILLVVSGVALAVGITGLVVGLALRPSTADKSQAVIRSHQEYIKSEQVTKRNIYSSRYLQKRPAQQACGATTLLRMQ